MSSWSRVKIRGLKSSIEVQLPTVSGNLKKMLIIARPKGVLPKAARPKGGLFW